MPEKYILLEDTVAHKQKGWNPLYKSFVDEHILKGSLLVALTDVEARDSHQYFSPPLNYKKYSDDLLKLYCKPEYVHQLSEKHFQLLLAVRLPFDRFKALNILNLVEKLVVGHGVNVVISSIPHPVKGIIRYIGALPGEEGTQFGVELLERRGEGASDGTFQHMEFFKCDYDCAMFVAMDKLSNLVDSKANTAIAGPPLAQDTPLNLGDKVTFHDESDKALSGVVRWIGRVLPNKSLIVGIETDYQTRSALVPDSLSGMNYCFDLRNPNGRKLFLPISAVVKNNPYPESTVHILQCYSGKEGQSVENFKSQQRELHQNWEAKKRHEEVVRAEQYKPPGTDVDLHEIDIEEQRRIYEEARRASKQGGGGQRHDPDQQPGVRSHFNFEGISGNLQSGKRVSLPVARLAPDPQLGGVTSDVPNFSSPDIKTLEVNATVTELQQDFGILENQVKQSRDDHGGKLTEINTVVQELHQKLESALERFERNFRSIGMQINDYQRRTEESIHRMETNVDTAFRKAFEVQKRNEELQASSVYLQSQLSLTQQQLLGVQSMMTSSRLWVVSHDQFTIGREIGRGAWATVHETTFRGATVAAKRLHNVITSDETRKSFKQEMEMALQCQHENIVTFLGATMEGHPVILMELMTINLRSAYEQGVVKANQILGIFANIANALHFLHTRPKPVIHRDVSSANVLLKDCGDETWLAKLGDLGTARIQQQTTTPGPGCIAYAAPEVANPLQHSSKMDVYSFGVLILETLTKTHPFNKVEILKAHVNQQFPQYHQLVSNCTSQQARNRPKMFDVIEQLNKFEA